MAAKQADTSSAFGPQDASNSMPLGSMRAGLRLHGDFQKRVARQQQRCDAANAAEDAVVKSNLARHAPQPGVNTETIVQRLYQNALDKQAQKTKRLRLEEQRQTKLQEEQLRRQQQQMRPGITERLYQDHKRRSDALERKRQQQEDAQAEWLRLRSVHRRGGDAGVFTKAFSSASPKSSLPSTPSTTAPSTPPLSPPGTPGRQSRSGMLRISRAVALAQAAARLQDVQQARALPEKLEAEPGMLSEETLKSSNAEEVPNATHVVDKLKVQQEVQTCQAASASEVDSESARTADKAKTLEDEPKMFAVCDSDSDEEVEVEELQAEAEEESSEDRESKAKTLEDEPKMFTMYDSDSDEEVEVEELQAEAEEESSEESDNESEDEEEEESLSEMESW